MRLGLWVDDIRQAPEDSKYGIHWHIARSYERSLELLYTQSYDIVSLDHDLGCIDDDGNEKTGDDILCLLEERFYNNVKCHIPEIWIHTANFAKYQRMHNVADKLNQRRL